LGGAEPEDNYQVTIDWGDNSSTDTVSGYVRLAQGNEFNVFGSHSYASPGTFAIHVTIDDDGGSSAQATAMALVSSPGDLPPNQQYISGTYEDVLGRSADAAGLGFWTNALQQGTPRQAVATALTHSDEYYTDVITPAYELFLGREPDPAGLSYWINAMHRGLTDQQLQADFIGSTEFYSHAGGNDQDFIVALYWDLLGRNPDTAGLGYWVGALQKGAGRSSVAYSFTSSDEREEQVIGDDYRRLLNRSATASEIAYWLAAFKQGVTNEDLIADFIASAEYYARHTD
jgi:hypothetical protein